jgi:hypothetical protein
MLYNAQKILYNLQRNRSNINDLGVVPKSLQLFGIML